MTENYYKTNIRNYQSITTKSVLKNDLSSQAFYSEASLLSSTMTSSPKESKRSRRLIVDILVIIFGISSWVDINGLWVELPELVQVLPEHYNLASYIVVTSQLANIGPILFSTFRRFYSQKVLELPAIHITLIVGITSCGLLAAYWDKITYIAGDFHSTALLSLAFCLSLMDCTSSVLYLPFMANFKEVYIISYFVGEGMSGLFPSLLALAQGVGQQECKNISAPNISDILVQSNLTSTYKMQKIIQPARFSVTTFFIILAFMVALSWLAFILLNVLPVAKNERVNVHRGPSPSNPVIKDAFMASESLDKSSVSVSSPSEEFVAQKEKNITSTKYYILLFIQMYICFLHNGILSLQTYSCLAYGNMSYHLAVVLSSMANPAFCFLAMVIAANSLVMNIGLSVFISGWTGYILTTAILSPEPPLVNKTSGSVLLILAWILVIGLMAFTKASIASILRKTGGQSYLYWCGVVTQVGSAMGALVSFLLVQYTHIFQEYKSCQ